MRSIVQDDFPPAQAALSAALRRAYRATIDDGVPFEMQQMLDRLR